jgi:uncharacterized membrane protein
MTGGIKGDRQSRLRAATLIILVLGVIVAAYLVYVHFRPGALVCAEGSVINCSAVLTSSFSSILGVPLAVLALLWFAVAIALEYIKNNARKVWAILGIAGFAYSIAAMSMLGKICVYCSTIDAILLIYIIVIFRRGDA